MIEKMAEGLISRMAAEQLVNAGQRKQYEYAVISLAERFLTIGTILLISVWMKLFVPTVLFLVFFLELRKRTGGFHFNYCNGSGIEGAGVTEYYNDVLEAGVYFFAVGGYEGTGAFTFAFYQNSIDVNYEPNDTLNDAASIFFVTIQPRTLHLLQSP